MSLDTAQLPAPNPRLIEFALHGRGREALSLVTRYFDATLEQPQSIPRGGALLVSNHALFAIDSLVLAALLVRELGRAPRFLVDRKIFEIPGLRQLITAVGGLAGEPAAAEALLRAGELVLVYPGGVDDSLKLARDRHRLQWKQRAGFAKVALRAGVPIVPVTGLGIDDMYTIVARERWLGRTIFGSERYDLPLAFGALGTLVPRRVKQTYVVSPPIEPVGSADSEAAVEHMRAATYAAIESNLRALRERAR
jgi:1-acyl-sn-glycerol-3-phosphate acyltransferase